MLEGEDSAPSESTFLILLIDEDRLEVREWLRSLSWMAEALTNVALLDDADLWLTLEPSLRDADRQHSDVRDIGGGSASASFVVMEGHAEIASGERVMINGDLGANRHLLFFAMAGLWPWGSGSIVMPPQELTLFVPQHGYLPEALLREILAFPTAPDTFTDAMYEEVLTRCGLQRLVSRLDENARWDRKLDLDDQAALRIANILLLAPRHAVIEDILDGLEPGTQDRLVQALEDMEGTTIVYVGRSEAFLRIINPQVLHLRVYHANFAGDELALPDH